MTNTSVSSGYEIPQPLKYTEKLLGPVTFVQAGYLAIGLLFALFFYKAGGLSPFPIFLMVVSVSISIGLAFFKLGPKIQAITNYYKTPQRLGYLDKRLTALIGIKDVKNDTLVKRSNKRYAIIQVRPTNFMIKSEEDKAAIIANFQKFLNSIDHPVQILARTVNVDLSAYLTHLRKTVGSKVKRNKNLNLQRLFEDYCNFVQENIINTANKNRLFYLIVPAPVSANLDQETVLETRVEVCRDALASCGLVSRRLNSMQIVSLMSSFFEGYVEVDNDYLFPVTMLKKFADEVGV